MPMHRWMASAAGGISQRLNPGPAMMRSRPSHWSSMRGQSLPMFRIHAITLASAGSGRAQESEEMLIRHLERHRIARTGWLRAAVLGANDGLVSTASLVVGVAAAQATRGDILLAGVAGLVAGAMSM